MLPIRDLTLFSLQTALVASPSLAGAVFMRLKGLDYFDRFSFTVQHLLIDTPKSALYPVDQKILPTNTLLFCYKAPLIIESWNRICIRWFGGNLLTSRVFRALKMNLTSVV
jgi:hypothetical protein